MNLTTNLTHVLTGSTVAILATLVYSTLTNAFLSGGKFRSKGQAVVITLLTAFVLGILTPTINEFWEGVTYKVNYLQLLGILIIVGTFTVNQMVYRWRHTTRKSLIFYAIGLILIASEFL